MSSGQFGASFNHSCLKVPVNPCNQLPSTSYERKQVSHNSLEDTTNRVRARKSAHFQGVDLHNEYHSNERLEVSPTLALISPIYRKDNRKVRVLPPQFSTSCPSINATGVQESLESFIKFYENIPDYKDVNHLNDKEFKIKVECLREKQRKFFVSPNQKIDSTSSSPVDELLSYQPASTFKTRNKSQRNKIMHISAMTSSTLFYQPAVKEKDKRRYIKTKDRSKLNQHTTHFRRNQTLWNKHDGQETVGTPSTVSVSSEVTNLESQHKKSNLGKTSAGDSQPSKCVEQENDVFDCDEMYESKHKSSEDISELIFKENQKTLFSPSPVELYKTIKPTSNNGRTNQKDRNVKTRRSHSASSNKNVRNSAVDSSSSIVDSIWDGLSMEDYLPKSENLYSDSDSLIGINYPFVRSLPNSPILKPCKTVVWKEPKITVPEPFEMTMRDEEEANYKPREQEIYFTTDLKEESKHFKANPVPLHAQIPLYDKIVSNQEKRRRKLKRQCISELRSQMKPFSFVKRDEEQRRFRLTRSTPELREPNNIFAKPFKAKPVPKNLFGSLVYQRMREDEFYRTLKRKIRAEELLRTSSLPPSMAAREQISQAMLCVPVKYRDNSPERSPKKSHKIPNYKTSHDLMRRELDERLKDNISTSPQPFYLRTGQLRTRRSKRSSSLVESISPSPYECFSSMLANQRLRPRSALCHSANRNNLAAVLRIQSARQRLEREASLKEDEIKKKEEVRLKAQTKRCQPVWRSINYSTKEDLALRVQTRREEERRRREQHEQDMELMLYRVERIPTLFQRQSQVHKVKKSKKLDKSNVCSNAEYRKSSMTYSSPDLFGGGIDESNNSEEIDDKTLKQGSKVVSINDTAQTIGLPNKSSGSKPNESRDVAENEADYERVEVDDGDSSIHEDLLSGEESFDEEDNNKRSQE